MKVRDKMTHKCSHMSCYREAKCYTATVTTLAHLMPAFCEGGAHLFLATLPSLTRQGVRYLLHFRVNRVVRYLLHSRSTEGGESSQCHTGVEPTCVQVKPPLLFFFLLSSQWSELLTAYLPLVNGMASQSGQNFWVQPSEL